MRQIAAVTLLIMFASPLSLADVLVDDRGLSSEGEITGYSNYEVALTLDSGLPIGRELLRIKTIEVTNNPVFTKAEKLRAKKDYSKAVAQYRKAEAAARKRWMKRLISDRSYQAMVDGRMIDQAVKQWLKLVDAASVSQASLKLAPGKFAKAGAATNKKAVKVLEDKVTRLMRNKTRNKVYIKAVLALVMKIHEADGNSDGVTKTAERISSLDSRPKPTLQPGDNNGVKTPPVGPRSTKLKALAVRLKAGHPGDVIAAIETHFPKYRQVDRPEAMLLLGKAQLLKYKKDGRKNRKLLIEAGLNLMGVFSEYESETQAVEALYLASRVSRELGNKPAALRVLRELVNNYGDDEQQDTWVKKAEAELKAAGK
ncbi:MAG: hypothetical protein K8S55_08335 [Phycisphaerae bacterium]|nr:hypothetical protein [Phycisphaerae bacterium]